MLSLLSLVGLACGEGTLYGATFVGTGTGQNTTASLVRFDAAAGSWSTVLEFGVVPFAALAGMLATDPTGSKWWLAAGESGQRGQNTLFYAASATAAPVRLTTATPISTLEYVAAADEFLATWQEPGGNTHLHFGALDPYVAKENTMVDLTANASIPFATFGASALDPAATAYTFIVGIESAGGGRFSLARVAPTGHGVDVELGKPCASGCTLQSVVALPAPPPAARDPGAWQGARPPAVLTMSPQAHNATPGAVYTYTWAHWDLTMGAPILNSVPLGSWQSPMYNTFVTSAVGGGAVFSVDALVGPKSSVLKLELDTGTMVQLPMAGLQGALMDLVFVG